MINEVCVHVTSHSPQRPLDEGGESVLEIWFKIRLPRGNLEKSKEEESHMNKSPSKILNKSSEMGYKCFDKDVIPKARTME